MRKINMLSITNNPKTMLIKGYPIPKGSMLGSGTWNYRSLMTSKLCGTMRRTEFLREFIDIYAISSTKSAPYPTCWLAEWRVLRPSFRIWGTSTDSCKVLKNQTSLIISRRFRDDAVQWFNLSQCIKIHTVYYISIYHAPSLLLSPFINFILLRIAFFTRSWIYLGLP